MKRHIFTLLCAVVFTLTSHARVNTAPKELNYALRNEQAKKEYLQPVRPGYDKKNPYWNEFSFKFMYAPAVGFESVKGAKSYRYTIKENPEATEKIQKKSYKIINNTFAPVSFTAETPNNSLAPVWDKIPAANVILTVEALDAKNNVIKTVGERKFLRDFGFHGPYNNAIRPYKEAAIKGMLFIHNMEEMKCWIDSGLPNMKYEHYTYANKIISSVVSNEVLVSKYIPSESEKAIKTAEAAAEFLIKLSQPSNAPMAYFPPTYYKNLIASKRAENQGAVMTMDAVYVINAMLDLFDVTKKQKYYDFALNITRTYKKLQNKDGSFPIKAYIETAQPTNNGKAMLHSICRAALRWLQDYQVTEFEDMRTKAEKWMHDVAIRNFDMTGQFEDVSVNGLKPYENLTNCTAAPYANYLCSKQTQTTEELEDARDLLRLSEDQFTYWNFLYNELGIRRFNTPCVIEQYKYRTPVDASACNVSGGLLAYYRATGDKLAFAKAKAIIDNITIQQVQKNGYLPTTWSVSMNRTNELSIWLNCAESAISRLLEMSELVGE